jgi:hypothetical protein
MRKLQRLKPVLWTIFLLATLITILAALRINSVSCKTNYGDCTTHEQDVLNTNLHRFAFAINRKDITNELKKDPRVESVKIKLATGIRLEALINYKDNAVDIKVLPPVYEDKSATGSGVLWNRVNKMLSASSTESSYFKLWENGFLTSATATDDIEAIMYADKMPNSATLMSIFSQLTFIKQNFTGRPVYIQENAILMKIDDRTILLFDVNKEPQKVFETLQQIQAVTTIEKGTRLIDLRFNKPVISLNKNE